MLLREKPEEWSRLLQKNNPRRLKRLIGTSYALIGPRFHAIVNSLSQGIPTMGMGWSHKYVHLFQDYACEDLLHNLADDEDAFRAKHD